MVMPTRVKIFYYLSLVIGAQLIILGIAGGVRSLAISHSNSQLSVKSEQGYQPPSTIGSPKSSVGSGTR